VDSACAGALVVATMDADDTTPTTRHRRHDTDNTTPTNIGRTRGTCVTDLPAPTAQRLRPPSWRDPRLLVGLVLVLGSVVLGSRVVAAADDSVSVYAAARTLTPGEPVRADDVTVVQLRLDSGLDRYLPAGAPLPEEAVALRSVPAGELLPRSGLGSADELRRRPVGIPVDAPVPAGLVKAAQVDVWVSEPDPERSGAFTDPVRLATAAEVAEVTEGGGALGAGGSTNVQVLLAEDELRPALRALASDAEVALVLVPGSSPATR
jgi:hypothetical protein